jgi:CubicO group peptidase (beta-lactamase class C family)
MATLAEIPLVHQPGEGFTYNTAYDILGVFVARVTGGSFAAHVTERILLPLGMSDSGFAFPPGSADRTTTSYRRNVSGDLEVVDPPAGSSPPSRRSRRVRAATCRPPPTSWRSSGCSSQAAATCLPRELVTAMTTDQLTPALRATDSVFLDGQSWGFGGGVDIAPRNPWNVIGRYGWVGGTGTSAHVVPADGSLAVLLTQVELGGPTGSGVLETFWTAAAATWATTSEAQARPYGQCRHPLPQQAPRAARYAAVNTKNPLAGST